MWRFEMKKIVLLFFITMMWGCANNMQPEIMERAYKLCEPHGKLLGVETSYAGNHYYIIKAYCDNNIVVSESNYKVNPK